MALKTRTTLAEFLALPETKPYLELMDGEVLEKTMPSRIHSRIVAYLVSVLWEYLAHSQEGSVDTELRHIEDEEEWVFLPDVSVTRSERSRPPIESEGPETALPDLAIEVLSPDDRPGRVQRRIAHYMRSGVVLLWVIDPEAEKVTVWRQGDAPRDYAAPARIPAAPVLASFELDLQRMFDTLRSSNIPPA